MNHPNRKTLARVLCGAALLSLFATPPAGAQILPSRPVDIPRVDPLRDRLDRRLEKRVEDARERADEQTEPVEALAEDATDMADDAAATVGDGLGPVTDAAGRTVGTLRRFVGGVDRNGAAVEQAIIVVLVRPEDADALASRATNVLSRRELDGLNRVLLVLRAPAGVPMPEAIQSVRDSAPGAIVDYNHLYRATGESDGARVAEPATPEEGATEDDGALRVGVIDSAVMPEHQALRGVDVTAMDFVTHDAERPLTHGTAVASLVAQSSNKSARVYSGSVFFQVQGYAPGATAESLVAALDWMATEQVDVINMSLAGPGNALLEAAVAAIIEQRVPLVAAVGNAGPASPPLYPAAYDGVIGVTAVDRENKIFRYANRGAHVDFAARGVNVKVADSNTGSYRMESGTSMASPHVAVVVATLVRESSVDFDALTSWLTSGAEDLGRKGHDDTFGHGLITRTPTVASAQ